MPDLKRSNTKQRRTQDKSASVSVLHAENALKLQEQIKTQEQRDESNRIFKKMDADGSNTASREEIAKFIRKNDDLWYKINSRLKQPKEVARDAATRTAMELATGLEGQKALDAELTRDQFHDFRKKYMLDEDGKQEFFQRAIFATFDADLSGELDGDELKAYVDAIYETREVRKGRVSLLGKDQMLGLIMKKCDDDGNDTLAYAEVSNILGGGANALHQLKKEEEKGGALLVAEDDKKSDSGTSDKDQKPGQSVTEEKVKKRGSSSTRSRSRSRSADRVVRSRKQSRAAAAAIDDQQESDFCDWFERKVTGAPPGGPKKGFCRKGGCVVS